MKNYLKVSNLILFLTIHLILISCSTYKEVSCPDYSSKFVNFKKIKYTISDHKSYFKLNIAHLNKGKSDRNKFEKNNDTRQSDSIQSLTAINTNKIENRVSENKNLFASINNNKLIPTNDISKSILNFKSLYQSNNLNINTLRKEYKRFKKEFKKDSKPVNDLSVQNDNEGKSGLGFSIVSFILGLIGFPLAVIFVFGILATIFGAIGLNRGINQKKPVSIILSIFGLLFGIIDLALGILVVLSLLSATAV